MAIPGPVNSGKILCCLKAARSVSDLAEMVGTVVINSSTWSADTSTGLERVHKDAEIAAACFILHHLREDASTFEELKGVFADMTFEAKTLGTGMELSCEKLRMVDDEEKARANSGLSTYRLCMFIAALRDKVVELHSQRPETENITFASEAARLHAALTQGALNKKLECRHAEPVFKHGYEACRAGHRCHHGEVGGPQRTYYVR